MLVRIHECKNAHVCETSNYFYSKFPQLLKVLSGNVSL